jgi:hypothetical protein
MASFISYCHTEIGLLEKISVLISILKMFTNFHLELLSTTKKTFLHTPQYEPYALPKQSGVPWPGIRDELH